MRRRIIIGGMVVLGVGYGAYKLSKKDVEQIEKQTGKEAEQLSEEELKKAMADLGIESQEVTDQEMAQLEAADQAAQAQATATPPAKPATPPSAPAPSAEPDYLAELERLAGFKDKGIISEEEFNAKKKQLLGL
jgi:hypothetical protein